MVFAGFVNSWRATASPLPDVEPPVPDVSVIRGLESAASPWEFYARLASVPTDVLSQAVIQSHGSAPGLSRLLAVAHTSGSCLQACLETFDTSTHALLYQGGLQAASSGDAEDQLVRLIRESSAAYPPLHPGLAIAGLVIGSHILQRSWRPEVFESGQSLFTIALQADRTIAHDALASYHLKRFLTLRVARDLERAIELGEGAVSDGAHPERALYRDNQARRLDEVASRGNAGAAARARLLGVQALEETEPGPERFERMCRMARRVASHDPLGESAASWYVTAINDGRRLATAGQLSKVSVVSLEDDLATHLFERYRLAGQYDNLNRAISVGQRVVAEADVMWGMYPLLLDNQAIRLSARYEAIGDVADLEEAISLHETLAPHVGEVGGAETRDHYSNALFNRAARDRSQRDLERAIDLGYQAIAESDPSNPNRAGFLANQAQRLRLLGIFLNDGDVQDAAVRHAEAAVDATPASSPHLARRLSVSAMLIRDGLRNQPGRDDPSVAEDLIARALALTPVDHPARAERLLLNFELKVVRVARAWQREPQLGRLCSELATLLDRNAFSMTAVASIASKADGLAILGRNGLLEWEHIAELGDAALRAAGRMADFPITDLRGTAARDRRLVDIHASVEGLLGATVLAQHSCGRAHEACAAVERTLTAMADDLITRIPWDRAADSVPALVDEAVVLARRIELSLFEEEPRRVEARYVALLREIRVALDVPQVNHRGREVPSTLPAGDYVWVVLCFDRTIILKKSEDEIDSAEVMEVPRQVVADWIHALRGGVPELVGRSRGVPSSLGEAAVKRVISEMSAYFDRHLTSVDAPLAWLIPVGVLASLPWQAARPRRRLHVSAQAASRRRSTSPEGALVVFADPTADLPGARREAEEMKRRLSCNTYVGAEATLATLGELSGVHTLHIACHGTTEPALLLCDGKVTLSRHDLLARLWPTLDTLFLNACMSAATVAVIADQGLSLATVALLGGARRAVVALWPVDDIWAGVFAVGWYVAPDREGALEHAQSVTPHPVTRLAYQVFG
jgi:tetratricopeptide (TPR) repeat protein